MSILQDYTTTSAEAISVPPPTSTTGPSADQSRKRIKEEEEEEDEVNVPSSKRPPIAPGEVCAFVVTITILTQPHTCSPRHHPHTASQHT